MELLTTIKPPQVKSIYLWRFGKKMINSCNTEAQLRTARKWVQQAGNINPELAVSLSFELEDRKDYLKHLN